ncbi:MAG: CRISPR-associated endonuclease Cas2 [Anaerolineales bacterium]|nr:CRISPR-associated endonuclease Cas2 [Anaerolineales bacterium]
MAERARYVIAYDVPNDRRRYRIARLLEGHGERVQYSVFECHLDAAQFRKLWQELQKLMRTSEDSLRAYRLCPVCAGWVKVVGRATRVDDVPEVFIA